MNKILAPVLMLTPVRSLLSDDPAELLRFAVKAYRDGAVALATLIDVRGGAARALGSHVVVAADGRFCGYVSGGCVEAAVAAEALLAMEAGCDRIVSFGEGSPFLDIVLPCGGGITVAIHLLRGTYAIEHVLECLAERRTAGLRYARQSETLAAMEPPERAAVKNGDVLMVYRPNTRLIISGQTIEAQSVARLAEASGYQVILCGQDERQAGFDRQIDPFTSVVLLHHDLDKEASMLYIALKSPAFYIGALGSTRTHRRRTERLSGCGYGDSDLYRIKAPIGLFGPTRDSASLALSVVADIAATRLARYA